MYNKDSDSLNAGAPDIRLSGNQRMASMEAGQEGTLEDIYQELIGMGFSPEEAAKRAREFYNDMSMAQGGKAGIMAAAPGTYTQKRKDNMMAYGGIAGADGRKAYGIGSFFQKYVKDPIEMAITGKNPTQIENESQARVDREENIVRDIPADFDPTTDRLADITPTDPGTGPYTPFYEKIFDPVRNTYGGITNALTQGNLTSFLPFTQRMTDEGQQGILPFGIQDFLNLRNLESLQPYLKKEIRPAVAAQAATKTFKGQETGQPPVYETTPAIPEQAAIYEQRVNPLYPIAAGLGVGKYVSGLPKDTLPADTTSIDPAAIAAAAQGTDAQGIAAGLRFLPEQVTRAAEGGRIGAQEGGLMNLGGMEKDYREEGGFVPIGGKEKADDVPARLSKNEFVFTADAVRGAGGGDIDKGAKIMEDLMKRLEGARGMFANTQELEKRII